MTKKELQLIVRKIVKEELYSTLNEVLPALLSEVVAKNIVGNPLVQKTQPVTAQKQQKSTQRPTLNIKDNPMLTEIFATTSGGIVQENPWVDSGEQPQMSGDTDDPNMYSTGEHGEKIGIQQIEEVSPAVARALTRDYSEVLRESSKRSMNSTPSNIDFSKM